MFDKIAKTTMFWVMLIDAEFECVAEGREFSEIYWSKKNGMYILERPIASGF